MVQTISTSLTELELTHLIRNAVAVEIERRLAPSQQDELYTDPQARAYLKCSSVFLWKKRKEGKIKAVNAGKKLLYPKSSLDNYLQLKTAHKAMVSPATNQHER
ncbi:MAG: helix-turn-helix domain-containing protein [Chitinophagaceae bacterium]|nr:helix-turn-helix domain-containing protein [Chitinophagaceae bacterium]